MSAQITQIRIAGDDAARSTLAAYSGASSRALSTWVGYTR
jgi:hypothetical protein